MLAGIFSQYYTATLKEKHKKELGYAQHERPQNQAITSWSSESRNAFGKSSNR
jgi:hypothetical protein